MRRMLLLAVAALALAGCLSPAQRAELADLRDKETVAIERVVKAKEVLDHWAEVVQDKDKLLELGLTPEKALEEWHTARNVYDGLKTDAEAVTGKIEELRKKGVPWWAIVGVTAWTLITGLLGKATIRGWLMEKVAVGLSSALQKSKAEELGEDGTKAELYKAGAPPALAHEVLLKADALGAPPAPETT